MPVKNIAPGALSDWIKDPARAKPFLLDVREPWEFQTAHIENAQLLPLRELQEPLVAAGLKVTLLGGADVASELDAKRAINQASRIAAAA